MSLFDTQNKEKAMTQSNGISKMTDIVESGIVESHGIPMTVVQLQKYFEDFQYSEYVVDPTYNLTKYLKKLGLPNAATGVYDVLVIDCPRCGRASYYDGSPFDCCKACSYWNLANHSDCAYTLAEYAQCVTRKVIENAKRRMYLSEGERMHG